MSSYEDPNQPATDATTWWATSPAPSDPAGAGSAGYGGSAEHGGPAGYGGSAGVARPAAILPPNAVAPLPHPDERVPHPAAQRPQRRRVRRIVVAGVAAVVLAAGGGIAGAAGMHALDHGYAATNATGAPVQSVANATSIADVVAAVDQEVVSITVRGQQVADEGSGVVVSSDGLILTNSHVIAAAQSGGTIQVTFTSGKTVNASIVKADANEDLALIQASGVSGLRAATFGNSDNLQIGDTVIAIGNELGLSNSVSAGIVSALHRQVSVGGDNSGGRAAQTGTTYNDAIQTDASTNQGDSGGALFNVAGQVVGINSAIATASDGGTGSVGIGFAISSNTAAKFIASAAHT